MYSMLHSYFAKNLNLKIPLPISYTFAVTEKCNSQCQTCNIHKRVRLLGSLRSPNNELTTDEWSKIFESIGRSSYWATISGGEPTLRNDLYEILTSLIEICRPAVIVIPTNSILGDRLVATLKKLLGKYDNITFKVNLSLDGLGQAHDRIRGVEFNYLKVLKLYDELVALSSDEQSRGQLNVGLYTILSKFNLDQMKSLGTLIRYLHPQSYGIEVAQNRVELDNENLDITPNAEEVETAIADLKSSLMKDNGVIPDWYDIRREYLKFAIKTLKEKKRILPCYAGYASAQIDPFGDVWGCCVNARSMGNLRDFNYDFRKIWTSDQANSIRNETKSCYCLMANVFTTSALFSPKILISRIKYLQRYREGRI
jgi:MoaA/NifB/PqqE/SkfB family radical SAM enzyme